MPMRPLIFLLLLAGLNTASRAALVDLIESIDQARIDESSVLHAWLRDPLEGPWTKTTRGDGGETWTTIIVFPVPPGTREFRVRYGGSTLPELAPGGSPADSVCYSLEIPESDDLGCRLLFQQNRAISRTVDFRPADRAFVSLRARGSQAQGIYPIARFFVESSPVLSWDVASGGWRRYSGSFTPPGGRAEIQLSFANDGTNPRNGEDRNLYVDRAEILYPATLSIHFPPGAAREYSPDGFDFLCAPEAEALFTALAQPSFLTPFIIQDEPRHRSSIVHDVEVNSVSRRCLRLGAPARVEWDLSLAPGPSRLAFAYGTEDFGGDGCSVRLIVKDGDSETTAWDCYVPPPADREGAFWREVEVDLASWQGREVTLQLSVDSGIPLHGPFLRDKSGEHSLGFLFAAPALISGEPPTDPKNIILICLDTLRADHLSCYGYPRNTSPALDRFAAESVRFSYCISPGNMTLSAHGSLFTSLLSREHGAITLPTRMRDGLATFPGVLRAAGYRTAAFVDGGFLAPFYGFNQGFDLYDSTGGHAKHIFPRAERWLEENADFAPLFLFIHVYDVHTPYNGEADARDGGYRALLDPHPDYARIPDLANLVETDAIRRIQKGQLPVNQHDVDHIIGLYDAGIRLLDDRLRDLFRSLEQQGQFDRTLVVVISDHGEHFGERGYWLHGGPSLLRELLHVPLFMRFPGREHGGLVVDEPASLLDLFPTFCGFAGITPPPSIRGRSLIPLIQGGAEPTVRDLLSETVPSKSISLTNREAKGILTYSGEPGLAELYDMRYDRMERVNLAEREPELAAEIIDRLTPLIRIEAPPEESDNAEGALDPELAAQMKALGYLGR